MKRRLAIITEIIAPYRVPVFNELAKRSDIDLHVIFLAETDTTRYQWHVERDALNFSHEILPSWRTRVGGWDLLLNWRVDESLRRARPDTILCGGYNYIASWRALRWAKQNHVPFCLWVESTSRDHRSRAHLVESLKLRFISECDGFVVPGKSAYEYVRSYRTDDAVISFAPNAVDTNFFFTHSTKARADAIELRRRLGLPGRYFLFVGRFVPEKGIFDLLEAYSLLPSSIRNEIGLVLVGDGPARSHIARAAKIGNGRIQIRGFAQQEELAAYYGLAETFVFPTHTDPWGLVVNEAMSCGLPVICSSAAGCAADLVRDGINGRLVRPFDIDQLMSAMEQLALERHAAARYGQESRRIISQYSPAACAAGIAEIVVPRRAAA